MTDAELIEAFEAAAIPPDQWKHETHVRVAWILVDRHGVQDAIERMREGIKRLNAANGVVDSLHSGYHETLTVAWLRVIDAIRISRGAEASSKAFFDEHTQLHSKMMLRLFYSRDRIMSAEAKASFVEPDLTGLPVAERADHD